MRIRHLVSIMLIITCIGFNQFFAQDRPINVLVLNAYSYDYVWTRNMIEAFNTASNQSKYDYDMHYEFMDTKRYYSDDYFDYYYDYLTYKYTSASFDVVIATDDYAYQFVIDHRQSLFKDTPVYFTGVNSWEPYLSQDVSGTYGIVEYPSVVETLEVALIYMPNLDQVYFIMDPTPLGQAAFQEISQQVKTFDTLKFTWLANESLDQSIEALQNIKTENSILLLGVYITSADGQTHLDLKTVNSAIVNASPIPVYAIWSFSLDSGVIGGKLIDSTSQANQIFKWYEEDLKLGKPISDHLLIYNEANTYMFDEAALVNHGYSKKLLLKELSSSIQYLHFGTSMEA